MTDETVPWHVRVGVPLVAFGAGTGSAAAAVALGSWPVTLLPASALAGTALALLIGGVLVELAYGDPITTDHLTEGMT